MARQVGLAAQALATAEGAATGAGRAWTTLIDIPLLFTLALRTIRKIGHCYGFPLEDRRGRALVLAILVIAVSGSLETRRRRLDRLLDIEDLLLEEAQEEVVLEEALSLLFQLEAFERSTGDGRHLGGRVERSDDEPRQRCVAADLPGAMAPPGREGGRDPAGRGPPRALAGGVAGALGRLGYAGCYYVGFGVALPVYAAAALVRPMNNALTRGVDRTLARAGATSNARPRRRRSPTLSTA